MPAARLRDYRNWNNHSYAESHVEEWVAKCPAALYPGRAVRVLASQNYARLGEKIDLLLLDGDWLFHVLELKAERVARNRGVPPDQINAQMTRYVNFLRGELPAFPASFAGYHAQFATTFFGSPLALADALQQDFGAESLSPRTRPPAICRTFLTEGYDDDAVAYFGRMRRDGPIRLVYYRFYPDRDRNGSTGCDDRIEFWEVSQSDEEDGTNPVAGRVASPVTSRPVPDFPPTGDCGEGADTPPKAAVRRPADDCKVVAPGPSGGLVCGDQSITGQHGLDASTYCFERQQLWARRRGVALQGSAGDRGRPAYAPTLEENLFEPLSVEARLEYEQGHGDELGGNMRAVHSSSALACNVFHYWKSRGNPNPIAAACGLPASGMEAIRFEPRLPITDAPNRAVFPYDPNPDVAFHYAAGQKVRAAAVECKFGEPYDPRGHPGLVASYLKQPGLWAGLPHCEALATRISPSDGEFEYLHAAQLLKHVLGLRHAHGTSGFVLAYLWYDVPGQAGVQHRREVERFAGIVRQDGIDFRPVTYQEVILDLARAHRDGHTAYIDYLAERYL